jgi:hypothetical protein
MSLHSAKASTFTQCKQFVALEAANVARVNHVMVSSMLSPATSGAGACITGPGTSITSPSIIYTNDEVPAGALLRGFSIGVMAGNPGIITGVGVYDQTTFTYTNLYNLYSREVVGATDEKFVDAFRNEVQQTIQDAITNGATSAITLSAITNSKVLLRPIDSVNYVPLHPVTSGGNVMGTDSTSRVMPVLAFAGYSPVPTSISGYKSGGYTSAASYTGATAPGPFKAGGAFSVKATFEWYTANESTQA